jgi:D-glycero-D-manno-heptose 1,7-bisphosphate phosphatase
VSERQPAAFLDRDGTIIHDVDFISRTEDVRLVRGAAAAIGTLNDAGIPVIVVSNQSGIGRGYFTYDTFERVQARIEELLGAAGAHIDATYICPHAPSEEAPCVCRKPGVALFERAARDHDIDLARSCYAGDKWRDVEPGLRLGGSAFLIPAPSTPPEELERARALGIVRQSLAEVAREMIITLTGEHRRR